MKQFLLALISLLCASSAWAAQDGEQEKQLVQAADVQSQIEDSSSGNDGSDGQKKSGMNGSATRDKTVFREMVVTGEIERDSHFTSPSMRVTRAQIEQQNAQTAEEVLKYMPSLQIRQRYVGDPNGMLGIRGADMFSTARSMVYADGLPLHNFLQASFNGAPRWSLVGPNEIDSVDVVYGPFSAEYSGNSIGGVVNIGHVCRVSRSFMRRAVCSYNLTGITDQIRERSSVTGSIFPTATGYRTNLRCFWPITVWKHRVTRNLISLIIPGCSTYREEHR